MPRRLVGSTRYRRKFFKGLLKRLGLEPSRIDNLRHKEEFLLTLEPFLEHDELSYYEVSRMQGLDPCQVARFLSMAYSMDLLEKVRQVTTRRAKFWIYTKT